MAKQGKRSTKSKKDKTGQADRQAVVMETRKRAFVAEYLKTWNVKTAAEAIGLEGRRTGARYLAEPFVQDLIAEEMQKRLADVGITPSRIIHEMGSLALSNMDDYGVWEGTSFIMNPSTELTRDQKACIQSIEVKQTKFGPQARFKLYDKTKATELLAKLMGMLKLEEGPNQRDEATILAKHIRETVAAMNAVTDMKPKKEGKAK